MKKRTLTILLVIVMLLSTFLVSACSVFDRTVKIVLNNNGLIENTYTVSLFKNAILADISTDHVIGKGEIPEGETEAPDVEFLGWHPDAGATNGMYKAGGLARLVEIEQYARDGVVVLYAIFGVRVIEKHDLIVAWYNRPNTSGLTSDIAAKYESALIEWLEDEHGLTGLDIVVKGYEGDVGTTGSAVLYDGGADIMLGWGGNLPSTGGITPIDRQDEVAMGTKTGRYIDLIRESEKMFDADTSLSRLVWQWSIDNADWLFV